MQTHLWNIRVRGQQLTLRAANRQELLKRLERVLGHVSQQVQVDATPLTDCHAFFTRGALRVPLPAGLPVHRA